MKIKLVVLAFALLAPLSAAAQTVTTEGGLAGFGVAARTSFGTVSDGVGGFYAGVKVADLIPSATWVQPYFAGNGFSDLGALWQAGINFRLGPQQWLARPVARFGAAVADGAEPTGGLGVYVGRRGGGLFTVDFGAIEGVTFSVVHIGGYVNFP